MPSPVTADWYLKRSLENAVDSDGEYSAAQLENFSALAEAAGFGSDDVELSYQPSLSDAVYVALGADPTGVADSTAAINALIAYCSLHRVIGLVPQGVYRWRPTAAQLILGGAGLIGVKTNAKVDFTNDYAENPMARGSVLKIEYSVHNMIPLMAVHRGGTVVRDLVFWYPDQVARLVAGAFSIDATAYPTITGSPDIYAPPIISDHVHDDAGEALAAGSGVNCGGIDIDITIIGAWDGPFLGDADAREETWAANYSTGMSKGIAGFNVRVQGFWLNRGVHIERSGNTSSVTIVATPGFWTEASQMGVIASSAWDSDNPQPLIKYAQRNAIALSAKRKLVGVDIDIKARQMRRHYDFDSGDAMAKTITAVTRGADTTFTTAIPHDLAVDSKTWIADVEGLDGAFETGAAYTVIAVPTTTSFTIANDTSAASAWTSGTGTASAPCGPQGQDSGKFASLKMSCRGESCPQVGRISETAYWNRPDITISGQWKDPDDNDNAEDLLEVNSHKDRAGSISRSTSVWRSALTMSPEYGWTAYISTSIQRAGGRLLNSNVNDPTGFYIFTNKMIHRWCRGDNTMALIKTASVNATIIFTGGVLLGHSQGSKRLFDLPDASVGEAQKLFVESVKIYGCPDANLVLEDGVSLGTTWLGFDAGGCWSDPDREIEIDDDDDEDGAGGSGTDGIGEPEG